MRSMLLLKNVYVLANFLILWDTFRFMAIFFRFMATLRQIWILSMNKLTNMTS